MVTTLTLEQVKNLLADFQPGDKIKIEMTPTGNFVVNSTRNSTKTKNSTKTRHNTKTKKDILEEKYADLINQPITVTEAAEKYNVYRTTIIRWKGKGYIGVIQPGYRMTLNEAEVAYCAAIHHERKTSGLGYRGVPLLDDEGLPYKLKLPQLARCRRDKSQKNS